MGGARPEEDRSIFFQHPVFRRFLVHFHPVYLKLTNPLYFLETMYYLIRVPERLFISFILFHFLLLCTSLFYVIFWFSQTYISGYFDVDSSLFTGLDSVLVCFPQFYFAIHFTRLSNLWTSKKKRRK